MDASPAPDAATAPRSVQGPDALPALLLLAAGRSTRYGRPKQVDPLGPEGASLAVYTVLDALRSGFGRVVLVARPKVREVLAPHLEEQLGPDLPLVWVHQRVADLPAGVRPGIDPASRTRPWGTAHAILAARDLLTGPFGVANADDWYGPEALEALARALNGPSSSSPCPGVLVSYPAAATLPPGDGGVSRGLIDVQRTGAGGGQRVAGVAELREVAWTVEAPTAPNPGAGKRTLTGRDPGGGLMTFAPDAPVSMNLWGFDPCILPLLREGFLRFLEAQGADPMAEFALSTAVDDLLGRKALTLRLLEEGRRWFGVTHPEDAAWVRSRLEALHADGTYSVPLAHLLP